MYLPLIVLGAVANADKESLNGIQEIVQTVIDKSPYWLVGFIIIIMTFIFAKVVRGIVSDKVASKLDDDHQDVVVLVGRTTYVCILTIGIMIGMKVGGLDLTPLVAAVGFGMGFAMQGIISNFMAGVLILISRHFTIGDYIKIDDLVGKVIEVQSRATILQAIDGTRVIVPNADLFSKQVISFTSNPFRRHEVIASVGYDCDLVKATQVCMATLLSMEGVLKDPAPQVLITEFDNSWVNLTLRFWTESRSNWLHIKSEVTRLSKENLEKVGMYVPYQIQQIYRYNGEDTKKEQEKLMKENFAEFEEILSKHKPAKEDLNPIQPNGEEKNGSEFLAKKS